MLRSQPQLSAAFISPMIILAVAGTANCSVLNQTVCDRPYLVAESSTVADIAATALLSPLALLPTYRTAHPWLFDKITTIHHECHEPLPPGLF